MIRMNVPGVVQTSSPSVAPAPTSPLEVVVASLWSFMLQLSNIGRQDDFLLLGGDALCGTRLLTSVKAVFGVKVTLQKLFDNAATVAGMARTIEAARAAKGTV
jgi:hypothetical protein